MTVQEKGVERDSDRPAFPCFTHPDSRDGYGMSGMSLRDWFAGQVLVGLMGYATINQPGNAAALAKFAYAHADAMLVARSNSGVSS